MIGSGWTAPTNAGSNRAFLKLLEIGCRCPLSIPVLQNFLSRHIIHLLPGQKPLVKAAVSRPRGRRFPSAPVNMKMRICISTSWKCGVVKRDKSFLRLLAQISLLLLSKMMKQDATRHRMEMYGCRKSMVLQVPLRFLGRPIPRLKQDTTKMTMRLRYES